MNTPAPAPSKAHMQSLIDTSIRPNPYEPVVGDIYGREPPRPSSSINVSSGGGCTNVLTFEASTPCRIVVLGPSTALPTPAMMVLDDGREETLSNLPAYLASIHGIEPIGRVRAHDPEAADTSPSPVADLERRLAESQNEAAQLRRSVDRLIAEKHAAT